MTGGRVRSLVQGTLAPLKGNYLVPYSSVCMARYPRGSYIVYPLLCLDVAIPEKTFDSTLVSHVGSTHEVPKSASQAIRMQQFTLHAVRRTRHGAPR